MSGGDRAAAASSAASATTAGGLLRLIVLVVLFVVVLVGLLSSGGVELGRDQRVVLGAQVDVIVVLGRGRGAVGLVAGLELLVALEGLDLLHCHFELVGDPRVGPPLADPGADAVELRSEGSACHIGSGD